MSILNLLGVDHNSLEFDGALGDKTVQYIIRLANGEYEESNVELANACLRDIKLEAESLIGLEDISSNVSNLKECVEVLFEHKVNAIKSLKRLESFISSLEQTDEIANILYDLDSVIDNLNYNNSTISVHDLFHKQKDCLDFKFIPTEAIFSHEYKQGEVVYENKDWKFFVKTFVGYRGNIELTGKEIYYKDKYYIGCYNKIIKSGLDPHKLTKEDVQLLGGILDSSNKEVYNLFIDTDEK